MSGPVVTSSSARDSAPGVASPASPAREMSTGLRQWLVVVLAVLSGATDAIGLVALGGAFTSVMTGNLVILGVSASTTDGELATASGGAIVAFCLGVYAGARLAGSARAGDAVWPRAVTLGLVVELVLMTAYGIGWWISGGEPGTVLTQVLLFTMAAALGIQSSTVQRFGVNGLSTTYLTGTLTTVVMKLAGGKGLREVRGSLQILLGLVVGAAAGAGLVEVAPLLAPVLQIGCLAAVIVVAVVVTRRRPS
ncbi:YoaK family protein [Blastococcus sp. URHD0036]|uniref:YoaK family protein n=1 Tax=Blastococcus sp. URHD0036 TaxID=1380356 RepID=UPI000A43B3ED|nr:YoaK family protein [Blastococcus sp. URHD0036]